MAISEPTQPVAGASASVAKARTSFGILGAISLSHLLNDMIQSLILAIYPLLGNDSNLLIVFYVQIMPDDFVMQLHRF
ncbi:fosmidomycin resistance protein [Klebsiella pneumoniae]|nr:Fosmidomycin resistance protein [Providencia stuartii]SWZ39611.1 fosmidomycin resistance protein [Klebsiella pneumoniae]SXY90776.1 fosmidomycin resistance protein [Klebsiella pneumoniae]